MSKPGSEASAIEIRLDSGTVVRGQQWGAGTVTAVLLHEPGLDLDAWRDLPELLADDGLTVVAVDLPGHGLSDDPWQPNDLPTVIERLVSAVRGSEASVIVVVAAGVCVTAALSLPASTAIAGVVAFSPQLSDPEAQPDRHWPARPKLIFVGASDTQALSAAKSVSRLAGWSLLSSIPTERQGTGLLTGSWDAQIREQTLGFVREIQARRQFPSLPGRRSSGN